jgi:hypothetical protein
LKLTLVLYIEEAIRSVLFSSRSVWGYSFIVRIEPNDGPFTGSYRRPVKSMVVGRPILLALEDIDGSPSFLEKALTFIETYGTSFHLSADLKSYTPMSHCKSCFYASDFNALICVNRCWGGRDIAAVCRC